jgi:DNA-binding transcriptional MerR regulator
MSSADLLELEARHPDGLSCAQILEVFESRGIRLSEATFRKYVQVGLLPRSRRVGQKGKHKGSKGIYPVGTLRQISEIKRMMALDFTIEEIQQQFAFVGGELEELRRLLERIMEKLEQGMSADGANHLAAVGARRQFEEAKRSAQQLVDQLAEAAKLIRDQARVARDAV